MSYDASTSSYATETEKVSATQLNANFTRKLDLGMHKEAAEAGSAFIRAKLRQEASVREILPPVLIGPEDLDRALDSDQPRKIVEKEPDSYATFVPFYGTGDRTVFRGYRYEVRFGKVVSQHFRKQKWELMSYQNDIRKILSDNSVKDMAEQEDGKFVTTCDAILTAAPAQVITSPSFSATAFTGLQQNMANRKMPRGQMLMTEACYLEAGTLPYTAVGQVAARHYDEGVEDKKQLWGKPVITTIHNNIVTGHGGSTYSVYLFAPANYLGNFFMLQDATLYIEQRADIISFHSYEGIGIGIGNSFGISRLDIA